MAKPEAFVQTANYCRWVCRNAELMYGRNILRPQRLWVILHNTLEITILQSYCAGAIYCTPTFYHFDTPSQPTASSTNISKKGLPFPAGPDPQLINSN